MTRVKAGSLPLAEPSMRAVPGLEPLLRLDGSQVPYLLGEYRESATRWRRVGRTGIEPVFS